MKRLYLFIILWSAFACAEEGEIFPSSPAQIAALTMDSSMLIGGIVSPLSGMPVLRTTDLIARGAQDIVLSRVYLCPHMPVAFTQAKEHQGEYEKRALAEYLGNRYRGWQILPHVRLDYYPRSKQLLVTEPNGVTLSFQLEGEGVMLHAEPYALCNTSGDRPGGQYDLRNTRIAYSQDEVVINGIDGTTRIYKPDKVLDERMLYLLHKEILPGGKRLTYHYGNKVVRIDSHDPHERHTYASLTLQGSPAQGNVHCTSSSGQAADYSYTRKEIEWKIKEKGKKKEEKKVNTPPLLASVNSPFFASESINYCRHCLIANYLGKDVQFGVYNNGFGNPRQYRAHTLSQPVGEADAFGLTHTFDYNPPIAGRKAGFTSVLYADGTSTLYHFSKELLLTAIQFFDTQKQLQREKRYTWTEQQWLQSLEECDGQRNLLYRKTYSYDRFGNPCLEALSGDLTGDGTVQTLTTRRSFTQDGRNLLLVEEEEGSVKTCYSYVPGTHLLSSKTLKENERVIQSTKFTYDDCNNLIEIGTDDGVARRKTRYGLRAAQPYLHMPEWVIDAYEQDGSEKLLKKRRLLYDNSGHVVQEEVYSADGTLAYTLFKTYDARGHLITQTDPLGHEITYAYDTRGRCQASNNRTWNYDMKGRLLAQTHSGQMHAYTYDAYDRCLSQVDPFNNTTLYAVDPLTSQVIRTDFPPIDVEGRRTPVTTRATYDPFGRQLTAQDANGQPTTYRRNAYGSPVEIIYPDGSKEAFRYTKNGALASHTQRDGLTVQYTYDSLQRPLKKTYIKEGEMLAQETFAYRGSFLTAQTNKEGHEMHYFYDGAGRMVREERAGRTSRYTYDTLGELATVQTQNLITHYTRDRLGRIIEEKKMGVDGTLLHRVGMGYDAEGHCTSIQRTIQGKKSVQTFRYDPWGRCVEELDAEKNSTSRRFEEQRSPLGQRVLCVRTTDPLQNTTVETYDALSRLVKKERFDAANQRLALQERIYDPHGDLLVHRESGQEIRYAYTPMHQVRRCSQGTEYTYHAGRLAIKTLPDGTTLHYTYNPLGFVSRIDSSDGAIQHAFVTDRLGRLTAATDEKLQLRVERRLDPLGNVVFESFPNGLTVEKSYDDLDRVTSLILPHARIDYTYDPLYLRHVRRSTPTGEVLYTHTFTAYDENGNLLLEQPPGNLGYITHMTDVRGQKTAIHSSYFSEQCQYDVCGNRIETVCDGVDYTYSYDALSQLILENSADTTFSYAYDAQYNRIEKNGAPANEQLQGFSYSYDPLQRLTEASTGTKRVLFTYDPLGRRLSKTVYQSIGFKEEQYLYDGDQEIACCAPDHKPLAFRVLAEGRTLAIELNDRMYTPLHDLQGNVRRLVDSESKTMADAYDFSAFGEELLSRRHLPNPWRFADQHLDCDLTLIDFGSCFYNPATGRWMNPSLDASLNPYPYLFNNPFPYKYPCSTTEEIGLCLRLRA